MKLPNYIEAKKRSKDKVIKELYKKNSDAQNIGLNKNANQFFFL